MYDEYGTRLSKPEGPQGSSGFSLFRRRRSAATWEQVRIADLRSLVLLGGCLSWDRDDIELRHKVEAAGADLVLHYLPGFDAEDVVATQRDRCAGGRPGTGEAAAVGPPAGPSGRQHGAGGDGADLDAER